MLQVVSASRRSLARAAGLLEAGRLVAFPTETVYGLGCRADDAKAVEKLYRVKNRPRGNPLIVHIASLAQARELAIFSPQAEALAKKFWPGALTLVLPYREGGAGIASGGRSSGQSGGGRGGGGLSSSLPVSLPSGVVVEVRKASEEGARRVPLAVPLGVPLGVDKTIALRIPADEVALALLEACKFPVAAPSANRSGEVSATEAAHVCKAFSKEEAEGAEEAGGAEQEPALVLTEWELSDDSSASSNSSRNSSSSLAVGKPAKEACELGIESTIVALLDGAPRLLRSGAIEARAIERVLGKPLGSSLVGADLQAGSGEVQLAPGGMVGGTARHYAPSRPLRLNARERLREREALLGFGGLAKGADLSLSEAGDLRQAARNLYRHLHALDRAPFDSIAVAPIPKRGLGVAINDRLLRATARS